MGSIWAAVWAAVWAAAGAAVWAAVWAAEVRRREREKGKAALAGVCFESVGSGPL